MANRQLFGLNKFKRLLPGRGNGNLQTMKETRFNFSGHSAMLAALGALALSPGLSLAEPQSSVAGTYPSSVIATLNQEVTQGKRLPSGKPRIVTQPETVARGPVAYPAVAPKVAVIKSTQAPLTARHGTAPSPVSTTSADAEKERILLAQLDADLQRTEKRLDSTNEKLSKGQQELMSLSGTLRTVMDEIGEDAQGLHPFVRVASRYAGTPYVWGGESRYGFDCSGFIIRVMRDLGYKALPHSAAEQFKYGTPVAQALLKPGDIVFFANTYKPGISHVGIYIGKRRFIHAASTREGTIVSSLDASPYKQKYAGARRLNAVR